MNIQVVNIKAHEHGSSIGRPSPLGNPCTIGKYTREEVIAMYRDWLRNAWKLNGEPKAELLRLSAHAKRCGGINLVCWCAPLPCHGEVIREAIHGIIAKGLV